MSSKTTAALIRGLVLLALSGVLQAKEFHVSVLGGDSNSGTKGKPWRTIQRAAEAAQPGDTITVHQGVYRERINPPRGGTSDQQRIVYRAGRGERVEIKGSELIKNWVRIRENVWKVTLPNSFFGTFNPYGDRIRGDWFNPKGREHHTGAVYLNGEWLVEATRLDEVLAAPGLLPQWLIDAALPGLSNLWFAQVDASNTTIWAQFDRIDPNEQQVEINVRQTVFYPDKPGRNFITVRGFLMMQAATPWAPPTAEQIGLIGTHWSKGWIIEDNVISHSVCSGIALGKYGDQWDNTSADTAEGYIKTIDRALENGWNRNTIGHHLVRHNVIAHCEQAGIVGSLGAAFSTVSGNIIHDIHVRRLFTGAEMAGIKFHGAIDSVISNNHIYSTCLGLWLDWMAQGTRVSANLFHDNGRDLFVEVNHGPFVVDNNLFLSGASLLDMSEGGAYLHNLFAGTLVSMPEPSRQTPYHPAHATTLAGLSSVKGGDCRFYNNIFAGPTNAAAKNAANFGLANYNPRELPLHTGGNLFYAPAWPYVKENYGLFSRTNSLGMALIPAGRHLMLKIGTGPELKQVQTQLITGALLGRAYVSDLPYENADGSSVQIRADYFGKQRNSTKPTPGPFENPAAGLVRVDVW